MEDMVSANIDNLTSLWQKAGEAFNSYQRFEDFELSSVTALEWPNRLWFKQDLTEDSLKQALAILDEKTASIVIPYWDIYSSQSFKILENEGFEERSTQIAMCLKLDQAYKEGNELTFKLASIAMDFETWSNLFTRSFGYRIAAEVLKRTHDDISYYTVYSGKEPVGTAIYFKTGGIVGVHAVGILQEQRRKGYAEEIMKFLLNRAIAEGANTVTLQASAMGKGLYDKLGFKEQFVIRNYALPKKG